MNIFLRRIFFQSNVMMNERSREVVRGDWSHLGENQNNAQVPSPNELTQNPNKKKRQRKIMMAKTRVSQRTSFIRRIFKMQE